jgi:hypothetical protein
LLLDGLTKKLRDLSDRQPEQVYLTGNVPVTVQRTRLAYKLRNRLTSELGYYGSTPQSELEQQRTDHVRQLSHEITDKLALTLKSKQLRIQGYQDSHINFTGC